MAVDSRWMDGFDKFSRWTVWSCEKLYNSDEADDGDGDGCLFGESATLLLLQG